MDHWAVEGYEVDEEQRSRANMAQQEALMKLFAVSYNYATVFSTWPYFAKGTCTWIVMTSMPCNLLFNMKRGLLALQYCSSHARQSGSSVRWRSAR